MKKFILSVSVLLIASFAGAKEWKKIRIATEGAWPPFNLTNSKGELEGFEVDYARALCKEMKAKCVIVQQDWDGIIPALMAKKFDAVIASMSITDKRKKTIQFSNPYYTTPAKFIAKKGTVRTISKKSLKNKTVAVQRATIHENFMNDNYKNIAKIKAYGKIEEAYLDLTAGRVDLVFADSFTMVDGFLNKPEGKKYAFVGPDFTDKKWFGDGVGIGLRKSDTDLKSQFDKAIAALYKNGTFKKLNDNYFDMYIGIDK